MQELGQRLDMGLDAAVPARRAWTSGMNAAAEGSYGEAVVGGLVGTGEIALTVLTAGQHQALSTTSRATTATARTSAAAASQNVNLASTQRTQHILYGDATGGGHMFGLTRLFNGKTKFPMTWGPQRIMNAVSEVATSPNSTWIQQTGKPGALFTKAGDPVTYRVEGIVDGINMRVIVRGDDLITAFPID